MYFKFTSYYLEKNPGLKAAVPSDELFAEFLNFINEKNFKYETQIEKKIREIEQLASEKKYELDIKNLLDKVELEAEEGEMKEINFAKDEILRSIVNEINTRIITESEQIEATFKFDVQLIEAEKNS